jgi:putative peptidoglycan lipid II flippase
MSQKAPPQAGRSDSIRRAGVKNVLISVVVAFSSYFSLTLVARTFGGSLGSDAYFFLASLTTLASGLLGSLLGTIFLPAFIELQTRGNRDEANRFASSVFSGYLLFSATAAAIAVTWHTAFFLGVSRFDQAHLADMRPVLIYFAPIFLTGVMAEFFRVLALALGRFTITAITALFAPALLIFFIFAFADSLHEEALAASLLLAKTATLVILAATVTWRDGIRLRIRWWPDPHTFRFLRSSAPYWSANVVTNLANFSCDYLASGLGAGVVTSIAYAQRVFMLPNLVFLNPILEIVRTKFAQFQAAGDRESYAAYYDNLTRLSLYFSIPIAAMFFFWSDGIIAALFQRGAFTAQDAAVSSACLQVFALSLPFTCLFSVNARACESFQRLLWPSVFGSIGNLLIIVLTFVFVHHAGFIGIPQARLAVDALYFLPFGFIAYQRFGGSPRYGQLAKSLFTAVLACALPMAAVEFVRQNQWPSLLPNLLQMGGWVLGFIAIYALILACIDRHVGAEVRQVFRARPASPAP